MLSNIVYVYINENAMFNKLDMIMLLNNKFINDRFYDNEKTNFRRIF